MTLDLETGQRRALGPGLNPTYPMDTCLRKTLPLQVRLYYHGRNSGRSYGLQAIHGTGRYCRNDPDVSHKSDNLGVNEANVSTVFL